MRLHHDQTATKEEAQRTLLFTVTALVELDALLETATANHELVEKYGVYKCPVCAGTQLVEEFFGDFDGGFDALVCTSCNSNSAMW